MAHKNRHNLITVAIVLIVAILVVIGLVMLQQSYKAVDSFDYGISNNDALPQSIEPYNRGGVSRTGDVVITWSGIISENLVDVVEMVPAARGDWKVLGNKLIFTPQKLAPGTLYTVSIPKGTVIRGDVSLKNDLNFSFETADDSLRYNEAKTVSASARSYYFSDNDEIVIPVSVAEGISGIKAELFRCDDCDNYLRAFNRIISLPDWAELSYAGLSVDTSDFKFLSGVDVEIVNDCIKLSPLKCGLYLLRISADGDSRDIAVSVGNGEISYLLDDHSLICTTAENMPNAYLIFNGKEQSADSAGSFVFDFPCDEKGFCSFSPYKAVIIRNDECDSVLFLNRDKLFHHYEGSLFTNRSIYRPGDDINIWGMIVNGFGRGIDNKVRLNISNVSGCVQKANINVSEGIFSYSIGAPLSIGDYKLSLIYDNSVIDSVFFSVGNDNPNALFNTSEEASDCILNGLGTPEQYQADYIPENSSVSLIDCKDEINLYNDNSIPVYASFGGSYAGIVMVSLCSGYLPDGIAGRCIYGEDIKNYSWGQSWENCVMFNTAEFWYEFSRINVKEDCFVRIVCYTPGKTTVSRYIPVNVHNGCNIKAENVYFGIADIENSIKFTLESDSYVNYSVIFEDDIYYGAGKETCSQQLKPMPVGKYGGEIIAYSGSTVLSQSKFLLILQHDTPIALKVSEKGGFAAFKVNNTYYDEAKFLLEQATIPGDQIFLRMERQLLGSLNEDGYFTGDIRGLSDLQNDDGGFGRYDNGESDLLLTTLVSFCADDMPYDKYCAVSYLSYRLSHADNPDDAALACWGLSALDKNVTDTLNILDRDNNITEKGRLFLLHAYISAGDNIKANKLFAEIKDSFDGEEGEYSAYIKALLLEAAVALNADETEEYISCLLSASVTNQTSRFLLFHAITRLMGAGDIIWMPGAVPKEDGYSVLYLDDISNEFDIGAESKFFVGGTEINRAIPGDGVTMSVSWEAEENHLYAVCVLKSQDINYLTSDLGGLHDVGNCYVDYVIGDTADIYLNVLRYNASAPLIYIFDMTSHQWIGTVDTSGWEVKP